MDLELSDDQSELVSTVRGFLSAERPLAALRESRPPEDVERRWRETAELGWLGISLDIDDGGVGYRFADEALVFEQLGHQVVPGPFLATALAIRLAALAGRGDLIEALSSGASRAGLAITTGEVEIGGGRVRGDALVLDGDGADHLLIRTPAQIALVGSAGAAYTRRPCLDETTSLDQASLDASVLLLADDDQAADLRIRANVLSAAMLAGMAQATCDLSVEFAKTRIQFGRPIGTFQAVSRRCADMATRAWSAGSLVRVAALCIDDARPDAAYQAAAAKAFAGQAAQSNGLDTIQNTGAIGWTAEHDAHFYVKRARLIDTVWGDVRAQVGTLIHDHPRSVGLGAEVPPIPVSIGSGSGCARGE